jgi:hypothetical protein
MPAHCGCGHRAAALRRAGLGVKFLPSRRGQSAGLFSYGGCPGPLRISAGSRSSARATDRRRRDGSCVAGGPQAGLLRILSIKCQGIKPANVRLERVF